jgi:hypothetical protein
MNAREHNIPRSRGSAAPVERTLGLAAEHFAAKEFTNVQTHKYTHDHFSRRVARARLLNSMRETPGRPGLAFLGEYRKGVEQWRPQYEFSSPSGSS